MPEIRALDTNSLEGLNTLFSISMVLMVDDIYCSSNLRCRRMQRRPSNSSGCRSEIAAHDVRAGAQFVTAALEHYVPCIQHIDPAGHRQSRGYVLLHDNDGTALLCQLPAHLHEVAHDDGRQAFKGLIQQNEARIANHRPRNGNHLLLPA